jgi:hypothetical protein
MSAKWTHIRIPAELHARLHALAGEMLLAHEEGRSALPGAYAEYCPIHHVITKALDELDGHKSRARQQSSRKTRAARNVVQATGMLTRIADETPEAFSGK